MKKIEFTDYEINLLRYLVSNELACWYQNSNLESLDSDTINFVKSKINEITKLIKKLGGENVNKTKIK